MMAARDWRRARSANLLAREAVELMLMAILCPMLTAAVLIVVVRPVLGTPERLVVLAVFAAYSLRAVWAAAQALRMRRAPGAGSRRVQPWP